MSQLKPWIHCLAAASAMLLAAGANAKVSPDEAAIIGLTETELTPVGAIRAGNVEGTIPAWTGGITQPPADYQSGGWYPTPFKDDHVLFTITAKNYEAYKDKLTPGVIALLEKYPDDFKLRVYPTQRSASYPQWFYKGSIKNAATTDWCSPSLGKNREERCLDTSTYERGVAFPIPKTGGQLAWNTTFYFFGIHYIMQGNGFNAYADGTYSEFKQRDIWYNVGYEEPDKKPTDAVFTRNGGALYCDSIQDIYPPRSAGQVFGGCLYFNDTDFDAYIYVPGQRRVRKAPELGFYDSPAVGTDGLRTADMRFVFNMTSSEEWYEYAPPERKEIFIPYNNYDLAQPIASFDQIVRPGHVNPDLVRWELHRVWVLRAKLKEGYRHIHPYRTSYIDEDTWMGVLGDAYDSNQKLWRVSVLLPINYYDVPMTYKIGTFHSDLLNGRMTGGVDWPQVGRSPTPPDFTTPIDASLFTPQGLRKYGMR